MTAERTALVAAALRTGLVGPGHFWRRLDVVDETRSTNDDLVATADPAAAVLLAEHQTAGRGRIGRSWEGVPRAQILMSVGVPTTGVPASQWSWLPLLAGVAIVDALSEVTGLRAGLKWPNDVLVNGQKLAGILADVAAASETVVVGLGLNVSLGADELPVPDATSLTLLGESGDRTALVRGVLAQLARRLTAWQRAGGADHGLIEDYRARNVTVGQRVRALLPGDREITGFARAIDDAGRLVIDPDSGSDAESVAVSAGDVVHLRPYGDAESE